MGLMTAGEKYGVYLHCNSKSSVTHTDCGAIYRWKETANSNGRPPTLQDESLQVAHTRVRVSHSRVPFEKFDQNPELSTSMPMMVGYQTPTSSFSTYLTNKGCLPNEPPGFAMEGLMGEVKGFGFFITAKNENIHLNRIRGLNVRDWSIVAGLQIWIYSKMLPEDEKSSTATIGMADKYKWKKIDEGEITPVESGKWLEFSDPILIEKRSTTGIMIVSTYTEIIFSSFEGGKYLAEDDYLLIPKGGWTTELENMFSNNVNPTVHEPWSFHGTLRYSIERMY